MVSSYLTLVSACNDSCFFNILIKISQIPNWLEVIEVFLNERLVDTYLHTVKRNFGHAYTTVHHTRRIICLYTQITTFKVPVPTPQRGTLI